MIGITILITALIAFFVGVVVGAAVVIFTEGSAPHVIEMEDSYQPFE